MMQINKIKKQTVLKKKTSTITLTKQPQQGNNQIKIFDKNSQFLPTPQSPPSKSFPPSSQVEQLPNTPPVDTSAKALGRIFFLILNQSWANQINQNNTGTELQIKRAFKSFFCHKKTIQNQTDPATNFLLSLIQVCSRYLDASGYIPHISLDPYRLYVS